MIVFVDIVDSDKFIYRFIYIFVRIGICVFAVLADKYSLFVNSEIEVLETKMVEVLTVDISTQERNSGSQRVDIFLQIKDNRIVVTTNIRAVDQRKIIVMTDFCFKLIEILCVIDFGRMVNDLFAVHL